MEGLRGHSQLVSDWNARAGLTSVPDHETIFRNYAESLEIWSVLGHEPVTAKIVDIGSGAGFPGLVGAVVSPDSAVHLVESQKRKSAFLVASRSALNLENMTVHAVRVEDLAGAGLGESVDAVFARAVAPLAVLLEYAAPLMCEGAMAIFPKGSNARSEVADTASVARQLGLKFTRLADLRPQVSATPHAAVYTKVDATPARFPRRAGVASRRPLS